MDCLFCKIIEGEIPSKKAYEDEFVLGFYDIDPQAPTHITFIPKQHIAGVDAVTAENSLHVAKIFEAIAKTAAGLGLSEGYRVVSNIGEHGQQSVRHLHFHLLGGRQMSWPPG